MNKELLKRHLLLVGITLILVGGLAMVMLLRDDLLYQALFHMRAGREMGEQFRQALLAYGSFAPVLFMAVQIIQVLLAPIPGEASGLLGGYLFGAWPGFVYSSIGLTAGSWIAFGIGRVIWDLMPERAMETRLYQRFNNLVCKGQFTIPLILFLIPGMPKDALSYLLGLSRMPLGTFLFIAVIGRMPGTLMLSFQGADMYGANYQRLLLLMVISLAIALPCYFYRRKLLAALLLRHRKKTRQNDTPAAQPPSEPRP
jgi:uncharacterized membrane protein YdjX (TVP38/TMEM64 family)